MDLTDDDVLEILKIFEQSKFDFLQLQQGERKITISKGGYVPTGAAPAVMPPMASPSPATPVPPAQPSADKPSAVPDGLDAITAPMVGKFYAAPSPSDPPYVEVGTKVTTGATVGLIEVMKVFASIKTEISGTIERILVNNGEFVEFGQPLFLIRPDGAARG
jgi:acetyl-CoA carboxylase biotin carboxyl carrier protein